MGVKKVFFKVMDYISETVELNHAYYDAESDGDKENDSMRQTQLNTEECSAGSGYLGQTLNGEEYSRHREDIDRHFDSTFDFNTVRGISEIPVKPYTFKDSIVGNIAYVLRMRAGKHSTNKRMDLSIACLRKAQEIMPISGITWTESDYMRLVEYLIRDCQFDEARKEWNRIKSNARGATTQEAVHKLAFEKTLESARELKIDLIRMSEHGATCSECSKYEGRVFSLSGKDKRFPRLPEQIFRQGGVHEGCRHSFGVFIEGLSPNDFHNYTSIEYSNRPFVDSRTPEQIAEYQESQRRRNAHVFDEEWFEKEKLKAIDYRDYETICERLPALAPKSFGGYRRMKSSHSKNYLNLIKTAREVGIDIR